MTYRQELVMELVRALNKKTGVEWVYDIENGAIQFTLFKDPFYVTTAFPVRLTHLDIGVEAYADIIVDNIARINLKPD